MKPDHDLLGLTLGAFLVFAAAAIYAPAVLQFLGRTRRLKAPPRFAVTIFRIWFALLAAASLWLLLAGHLGLFSRTGAS